MYPNLIKNLEYLAEHLVKKEFADIMQGMTVNERISFVNSIRTLQEPADYIQRNTSWTAS